MSKTLNKILTEVVDSATTSQAAILKGRPNIRFFPDVGLSCDCVRAYDPDPLVSSSDKQKRWLPLTFSGEVTVA